MFHISVVVLLSFVIWVLDRFFGRLGGVLGRFLVVLGGLKGVLGALLEVLGALGPLLGDLGSVLGDLGAVLVSPSFPGGLVTPPPLPPFTLPSRTLRKL